MTVDWGESALRAGVALGGVAFRTMVAAGLRTGEACGGSEGGQGDGLDVLAAARGQPTDDVALEEASIL